MSARTEHVGTTAEGSAVERSRRALLDEIGDPPDLTFVRGFGNRGDELIWAGTHELLSDRIYREIDCETLSSATGHTALLSGGGAFCRPYHTWMPRALAVAGMRFQRVIVLPSSFDPSEDAVREALARTRATVFARELESFRRIRSLCDARLAHDCAFFFDFAPYRREGEGVLNAFRTDEEGVASRLLPPDNVDLSAVVPGLEEWLETIAAHELVRTDRAHVMIAAAMLGKRVEYSASAYHKVSAIARFALREHPVVQAVSPPGAPATHDRSSDDASALEGRHRGPSRPVARARVTAVVLTRDRPRRALAAIDSLLPNQVGLQPLLLDNNSAPAAAAELAAGCAGRDHVVLRRSDRNLGCAGGRRLGMEQAGSELVLFLDDDAELEPGAVDLLVAELDAHPHLAAVTATVVLPDGATHHSGGWMRVSQAAAEFGLIGAGQSVERLPPSGPVDWVPGTAVLVRRDVLREFPIDERMRVYYEDNEWCYRVEHARPGSFRRSVEARAIHHLGSKHIRGTDFASRSAAIDRLDSAASFYELHGKLLSVDLFELVPELTDGGGAHDLAAARLLTELLVRKDPDWVFMEWMNGGLDVLLSASRRVSEARAEASELRLQAEELKLQAAVAHASLAGHQQQLALQREEISKLQVSHDTLVRIEQGGWWRMRTRLLPVLRLYSTLRRRDEH